MSIDAPIFPKGWHVFPLRAGTKQPIFNNWPALATDDPGEIAQWAYEYPDCNWAVATGKSGLAVIDVDGAEGEEALADWQIENGPLPDTRIHNTPRGGRHLIYSGDIKITAGKIAPHVDTRGGNSYIAIPPSTFEGKPYVTETEMDPTPIPQAAVDAAGAARERVSASDGLHLDGDVACARAARLVDDYIRADHVAVEGQGGDNLTYAVAAEIINLGLSPAKAHEILRPWNEKCRPPWPDDELGVKIENASRYAQNEAGAWYVPPVRDRIAPEALDKLIAQSKEADPAVIEQGERGRFAWMGEDEFVHLPPPQWLLKDKLVRESIAMLYGQSGHYKSFLALNLAAEVAQSGELAFYVAAEGISRMATQDFPAWKKAYGEERTIPFKLQEDMPYAERDGDLTLFMQKIDEIARREQRQVGLIVLDTLNNAMLGLEENSAKDAGRLIEALKNLKRAFKTTVLVIHHTAKRAGEDDGPRGSTALFAAFDTVIKVHSKPETKLAQMWIKKQKAFEVPGHPFSYAGRQIGNGLAFVPVTPKDAAVMSAEHDAYAPEKVSAALVKLKAWKPASVNSRVLAMTLVPRGENDSPEDYELTLGRATKALNAAAKKRLGGYCDGEGRGLKWSLPAPKED